VVLLNAVLGVSLYVRAINLHGAAAVSMLFCVIPAVAGVLSWLMLGQRVDIGTGVGLLLGALACWLNSSGRRAKAGGQERSDPGNVVGRSGEQRQDDPGRNGRRQNRVEAVHEPAVPR
jgi:hypothetical protein